MDKKTILIKTSKGESEVSGMSGDMKRVLLLIDGESTYAEVIKHAPPSLRGDLPDIIQSLIDSELIRDKSKVHAGPKIVAPKVVAPKVVTPKVEQAGEELDFTSMFVAPDPATLAAEAASAKAAQEAEKLKASQEAAKQKAEADAQAKAEAEARVKQEAARVRAELEAATKAKAEAEAAKLKAEQEAARIKAELESAKAKAEAEAKALAEERARQEAEAARIKAEAEAARIKAEQEAARIKAEQEAARIKAEQEAERIRAEQEAAAKAKADAEARAKEEAEAARLRLEQEAAKAKAEAEAKALAEERQRQEAEAARLKAEQEAARIKAEEEAARIKAEQDAAERAKAEEEKAARLKAEAEAARIKEEQEAAERVKAEEAARVKAEEDAARIKAEHEEAARIKLEAEAAAREKAEAEASRIKEEQEAARATAEQEATERSKAEAEVARKKSEADAAKTAQDKSKKDAAAGGFQIDLTALNSMDASTDADELAQSSSSETKKVSAVEKSVQQEEPEAKQDIAAEMARLKAEQEAERLRAEQEARALEEEQALAAEQESAWAEAEQRAEQQSKLDAAQAAKDAALAKAKSKQKSTTTRRRTPLPLGKIAAGILVLGIIALFALPVFWPMQEYIAPLEQRLSERFKQPVKVGSMSASLLPMPKIELVDVKVGATGEVTAPAATLNFDLLSLLSESKMIKDVTLQDVVVSGKDLEQIVVWLNGMGGDAQFPLAHVTLRNLKLVSDEISVPLLQGGADFDQGVFSRLALHSEDEKFNVELKAVANRTQIAFGIRDGALPLLPSATFSSFNARGEINANEINISDLDAHAYGGIWSGKGILNWSQGWKFDASIQAKTMELAELFPRYGLSGEVFIDGELSASSGSLSKLGNAIRVDASFEAKRGVINGIDMVETARLASHEHLVGGRTHFDELNGSFVAENGRVRFRSVRITSGMLKASGTFEAAADGELAGAFNSEIKMRSGNNPLTLSGSLSEPKLRAR
ncbi:MAG: hypothetical protein KJ850_09785 [Gammaproteobacteria bacterium]|nr:hypothetical protein [Gammaproteobacteria bacterium]MBU1625320.1 hypothetical protein [Gammaproteobacteria bacterium]MBU1981580.1 hypothetical protein [Gammaproteobacteria bacterium]